MSRKALSETLKLLNDVRRRAYDTGVLLRLTQQMGAAMLT